MSGRFTRKMYDDCAYQQNTKQSTDPLELVMDVNKFVNCNNICKPTGQAQATSAQLVDVESSLWGLDKTASDCDTAKHPFCSANGCLLTNDKRLPQHITPYACERGKAGDNAVITTNMKPANHPGYQLPNPNMCNAQGNGYYVNRNGTQAPAPQARAPVMNQRVQQLRAPLVQQRAPVSQIRAPGQN